MKKLPRKRRTREHVLADLSINHVERHALKCGFVAERVIHDYGIDLELLTFNKKGEIEEGKILLQVKATDRLQISSDQRSVALRIDRSDLVNWLAQPLPVILVLYHGPKDVAYWLYVQRHFRRMKNFSLFTSGQSVTIQMPIENVVTPSAMRRFSRFRARVIEQMRNVIHDED